ncbi:hypothetical protein [Bradyrhizobium genomosp. III]|uniref:hypothetical protein n=1 Tax=Bradyrhizobium genomosp. III TaxID=2683271 RepID=UPI00138AC268|nr:hypothetical protein [Bradyrhizobium sp. CCBAU 15615]
MKVSYVTSYQLGRTRIAFKEGSNVAVVIEILAPELKALYQFYRSMAERCSGPVITFTCERSNATDVWELNRIKDYRTDGFRKKPPNHADVLKSLDDYMTKEGIRLKFKRISLRKKNELAELINPKAVRPPLPGFREQPEDGDDLPQRRESARDLAQRAMVRDRR